MVVYRIRCRQHWGVVFATAALSVSRAAGSYQTKFTFTGSGFAAQERVQIYVAGVGSAILASATADSGGSFTSTVLNPMWPYGFRIFFGVGQNSGNAGTAQFSVTPKLSVNPNTGMVGSTASVQGSGFGFERVKIYWDNFQTYLGTANANIHGSFTGTAAFTFSVPTGTAAGVHVVIVQGEKSRAVAHARFTVEWYLANVDCNRGLAAEGCASVRGHTSKCARTSIRTGFPSHLKFVWKMAITGRWGWPVLSLPIGCIIFCNREQMGNSAG